jgi:hypothetical protein
LTEGGELTYSPREFFRAPHCEHSVFIGHFTFT